MNGPINSRFAVGPFVAGAPMLLIGVLFIAGLDSTMGDILGWIFVVVGVALLVLSMLMFRELSRWNKLRRTGWQKLVVKMVVDDAYGERDKTLVDTKDGKYRIAMARYPLELRDEIESSNVIEYVGELGDDTAILVRPRKGELEYFARCRSLAMLQPGTSA
ncbi:hypothetical protein [Blastococcus sp. Marseille-P5729]|uniref:hypothetical protein n=1 Tax=Blastococcus sp. Marseille-P5729 TaxID=2086582 RepID=UPI000D112F18|nr:hypothetical protein [Blastococcus sp. Marseille-P5729]